MINFNLPPLTGNEEQYVLESMKSTHISGDGVFTKRCHSWFELKLGCTKALLTTSCTHALEMAAILIDIHEGDEVIIPSYTFVSTANAFVLRGAKVIFVDIRPDTMNMDETLIEAAISPNTKAIVPVHYGGVACEMDTIMSIANRYGIWVIEDAAQGMMSTYKGRPLGTIGHLGVYSFHETKNITSGGEGGLLIINDERFQERAEIIREKGTNRSQFFRGMVDKYSWVDIGSSYLMNDMSAAFLWGQLEKVEKITANRLATWKKYYHSLKSLEEKGMLQLPSIPCDCVSNGHMFYLKVTNLEERTALITHLVNKGVLAVFHYIPLHSAPAGVKFGEFRGEDRFTTKESERLIRLPMYYELTNSELEKVILMCKSFFGMNS